MIEITETEIDLLAVLQQVRSPRAGAVVLFVGAAREFTGDRRTEALEYECYGPMARAKLAELAGEACRRWSLDGCCVVHRVGRVGAGEASVAIAVSSAHRSAAFAAGQWLIDTLKQVVPIWKKELWADGTSQWVHPGAEGTSTRLPPGDARGRA